MTDWLTVEETLARLMAATPPAPASELLELDDALGRVLALPLSAPRDVPAFDASQMDGIALNSAQVLNEAGPAIDWPISQRITAGDTPQALQPATAARIFTGAPLPAGADVVVAQEDCEFTDDRVRFPRDQVTAWRFVRRQGSDTRTGDTVAPAGIRLDARHLAQAASIGNGQVMVYRRLKVGVLSTGDELLSPGAEYRPGAVYDANRPLLCGMLRQLGAIPVDLGCAPDQPEALRARLLDDTTMDLLVVSGGMSVGEEDHVKAVIQAHGGLDFWRVRVKPGKPFACGWLNRDGQRLPVFGLPGNPVSVLVTFLLFVRPWLLRASGREPLVDQWRPLTVLKPLAADRRETYLRVKVQADGASAHTNQDSGAVSALAGSDGLLRIPAETEVAAGDRLDFIDYRSLLW
ncbi:MAG: molybdopterin molybdotransferase MoeA [Wenzhouxiangellaceae bacterium]